MVKLLMADSLHNTPTYFGGYIQMKTMNQGHSNFEHIVLKLVMKLISVFGTFDNFCKKNVFYILTVNVASFSGVQYYCEFPAHVFIYQSDIGSVSGSICHHEA